MQLSDNGQGTRDFKSVQFKGKFHQTDILKHNYEIHNTNI